MKQVLAITQKELRGYFGSPMAIIFIGAFLAATLFVFFWVDAFFVRGIADVRSLFQWMPVLMMFLVAALTMRQWSEEQRSGTLEILLTLPVRHVYLVLGKFLAVITLVIVALLLTIILPISVSFLGNLDWGPVIGGYLASILLAMAYTAIGLYASSRTDNQIVALISTVLGGGLFYLLGSAVLADLFSGLFGTILQAVGTGSRFSSIERGVIDIRDLMYYLSLTAIFLTLNVISLESKRWSSGSHTQKQRRVMTTTTVLVVVNLVVMNIWIYPLRGLRIDMTEDRIYSLSATTRALVADLQEPLLIRGYFSEKTHPYLAPLVPMIEDLLREYAIAANGMIDMEILDPAQYPEQEAEANQVYGIRPTPFQVTDRYEASVINSYFDILFRYGDQTVLLNYGDLIEVQVRTDGGFDVGLRNLEYDLTRSIKKVVYGFQSVDSVLAAMAEPARLTVYITPDSLPEWLLEVPDTIYTVTEAIAGPSNGKLQVEFINPDTGGDAITRESLYDDYGLQPLSPSIFSDQTYYLYMVLETSAGSQVLYPRGDLTEADVRTTIEAALKRLAPGFLKVAGVWLAPAVPYQDMFGQTQQPLQSWNEVLTQLATDYELRVLDLEDGVAPVGIDVLMLIAPQNMTDKQLYAVDQYLMRGGSVVVMAGNYIAMPDQMSGGLGLQPLSGTMQEMLSEYGINVGSELVMDPQNEPFPVPVVREVSGFQVQEIQAIDYPFFVDVRADGMSADSPIVANLSAVTLNWVSPVSLDEAANADRNTEILLESTSGSWLSADTNIQPNFEIYPELGFARPQSTQSYPLAVSVQGGFESFFTDRPSPFESDLTDEGAEQMLMQAQLDQSADTARLVVFGSAEFVDDFVFNLSFTMAQDRYINSLQVVQNAVDWSVEDLELLQIRSHGNQARLLVPLDEGQQSFWEGANYALALLALIGLAWVWRQERRNEVPIELDSPSRGSARKNEGVPK